MATLHQDLQVHVTWDIEPTEKAKDFVRSEVYKVLAETFQESSWLSELVKAEVHKALQEVSKPARER